MVGSFIGNPNRFCRQDNWSVRRFTINWTICIPRELSYWSTDEYQRVGHAHSLFNFICLVELIVLNIGLDFGILNTKLFTVMVIMAIFTTLATSPLVQVVCAQIQHEGTKSSPENLQSYPVSGLEMFDFTSPQGNFDHWEDLLTDMDHKRNSIEELELEESKRIMDSVKYRHPKYS